MCVCVFGWLDDWPACVHVYRLDFIVSQTICIDRRCECLDRAPFIINRACITWAVYTMLNSHFIFLLHSIRTIWFFPFVSRLFVSFHVWSFMYCTDDEREWEEGGWNGESNREKEEEGERERASVFVSHQAQVLNCYRSICSAFLRSLWTASVLSRYVAHPPPPSRPM